jgi:hypothetical protein
LLIRPTACRIIDSARALNGGDAKAMMLRPRGADAVLRRWLKVSRQVVYEFASPQVGGGLETPTFESGSFGVARATSGQFVRCQCGCRRECRRTARVWDGSVTSLWLSLASTPEASPSTKVRRPKVKASWERWPA